MNLNSIEGLTLDELTSQYDEEVLEAASCYIAPYTVACGSYLNWTYSWAYVYCPSGRYGTTCYWNAYWVSGSRYGQQIGYVC